MTTDKDITELESILSTTQSEVLKSHFTKLLQTLRNEQQTPPSAEPATQTTQEPTTQTTPEPTATTDQQPSAAAPAARKSMVLPTTPSTTPKFEAVASFYWEQDNEHVFVYVTLPGVGSVKDRVSCSFDEDRFDLKVLDFEGKNFRLVKNNLSHDINAAESSFKVFSKRVKVILQKTKSEFGSFDHWTDLISKSGKSRKPDLKADPSAGLMDMMKKLYDEGDENMKKTIGEAMLKSRQEKGMPM